MFDQMQARITVCFPFRKGIISHFIRFESENSV